MRKNCDSDTELDNKYIFEQDLREHGISPYVYLLHL